MSDLPAWLQQLHARATGGDRELQSYLRNPSSRPDIGRTPMPQRRLPPVNYRGYGRGPTFVPPQEQSAIYGSRDATPPLIPGFPAQARVTPDVLGRAARDVFGYATQGRGYQPPAGDLSPELQEMQMAQVPLTHGRVLPRMQSAPSQAPMGAPSMSASEAQNPLNGSLADYINTTMGLRPPPSPAPDREPWRQPMGAPRAGGENIPLPPGSPARVGGFAPPGAGYEPDEMAQLNSEWNDAVRRAQTAIAQSPDPTGLRRQSQREIEQMRLRQELEQRLPRLMAYQDFNRNR